MTERLFNLLECEVAEDPRVRDGNRFLRAMLGQAAGAKLTGLSIYELPAGEAAWSYHYELNREEWVIVVEGELVVRTPKGDRALRAGDVVCFPLGEEGAHQVRNDSHAVARFAMPSSWAGDGYVAVRPDSNTALIVGPGFRRIVPLDESLEYWDREP
ncbi:MAG TPA: cupin domain-containing protein [Gaiellaceae bacterium]|nr:cupin domain-containing protein [Gaiellaceae bacterium]